LSDREARSGVLRTAAGVHTVVGSWSEQIYMLIAKPIYASLNSEIGRLAAQSIKACSAPSLTFE
jgi:hypothetical protein